MGRELCLWPLDDIKECQRLGAGDRAMGRKGRCRRSAGDVVCIGPSDGSVVDQGTVHVMTRNKKEAHRPRVSYLSAAKSQGT